MKGMDPNQRNIEFQIIPILIIHLRNDLLFGRHVLNYFSLYYHLLVFYYASVLFIHVLQAEVLRYLSVVSLFVHLDYRYRDREVRLRHEHYVREKRILFEFVECYLKFVLVGGDFLVYFEEAFLIDGMEEIYLYVEASKVESLVISE